MRKKGFSKMIPNGSKWVQNCGEVLTVIEFLGGVNFKVKFEDTEVFMAQHKEIRNGGVLNKNCKNVLGVGYTGYGKYKAKVGRNNTPAYEVWRGMIRRCYDKKYIDYSRYGGSGVYVHQDWHNFQNFAEWYYTALAGLPEVNTKFDVDKDLKGLGFYSETSCILLPYKLNNFIQNKKFSSGVGYVKNTNNPHGKITVTVSLLGKQVYVGLCETQAEADREYNIAKNYVNTKMASAFFSEKLITKETSLMISHRNNNFSEVEEVELFKDRTTLKRRIDGLFEDKNNLLERCKGKISCEIYLDNIEKV